MSTTRPLPPRPQPSFTERRPFLRRSGATSLRYARGKPLAIDKFADARHPGPGRSAWRRLHDVDQPDRPHLQLPSPTALLAEWGSGCRPRTRSSPCTSVRSSWSRPTRACCSRCSPSVQPTASCGPTPRSPQKRSNHEIDLCQIYGLDETKTTMLRRGVDERRRARSAEEPAHRWAGVSPSSYSSRAVRWDAPVFRPAFAPDGGETLHDDRGCST